MIPCVKQQKRVFSSGLCLDTASLQINRTRRVDIQVVHVVIQLHVVVEGQGRGATARRERSVLIHFACLQLHPRGSRHHDGFVERHIQENGGVLAEHPVQIWTGDVQHNGGARLFPEFLDSVVHTLLGFGDQCAGGLFRIVVLEVG